MRRPPHIPAGRLLVRLASLVLLVVLAGPAVAQQNWQTQAEPRAAAPKPPRPQATVPPAPGVTAPGIAPPAAPRAPVPAAAAASPGAAASAAPRAGEGQVTLTAFITDDGQRIEQGMIWHVFQDAVPTENRQTKLVTSVRTAVPTLKLASGDYVITGSYGRAYATRRIRIAADQSTTEKFVLNAGGLRVQAKLPSGETAPAGVVTIDVFSDDRDQSGNRVLVAGGLKPGLVVRLNSGIYYLVSTYGDANAQVRADAAVEAGKLTEATIVHHAARVTLKLVNRAGGEALADTQWSIATPQGIVVKESIGALPTHLLAPGTYTAIARSAGRVFRRDFTVKLGDIAQVEVLAQ